MSEIARIFIIDDDAAVRDALSMLLEAAGYAVESFCCAADFLATGIPYTFGCIILDVDMPDTDGPALQEELLKLKVNLPVIFLSGHGTIPVAVRTIKAGAIDFLTKPVDGSVLLARVKMALNQRLLQDRRASSYQSVYSSLSTLTVREREVLQLALSGHVSKEIARRLGISFRTVEIHRANVLKKTGASNLLELAHITGLIDSIQSSQ